MKKGHLIFPFINGCCFQGTLNLLSLGNKKNWKFLIFEDWVFQEDAQVSLFKIWGPIFHLLDYSQWNSKMKHQKLHFITTF